MKLNKIFWVGLGSLGLALGAVGMILPVIPTCPFLMLSLFSYGKSSEKLHSWFISTKIYDRELRPFLEGHGMGWKTRLKIMALVSLLMGFGCFMMLRKALYIPSAVLVAVWLLHILYFSFGIKKSDRQNSSEDIGMEPGQGRSDSLELS